MDDITFLHKVTLFSSLNEQDIESISGIVSERTYPKDSIIFFEGEPGLGLFFLKSGRVKVSKMNLDGGEQILKIIEPGSVFAEVILFSDMDYPATARVMETAKIGMIKKQDFEDLIRKQPELAIRLLKLTNIRLREAQMKIKEMGLMDSHSRTASLLLRLAKKYGQSDGNKVSFELNLNRQELANMIGTTRETITRVLSKFRKLGIIELKGDKISLLKPDELESWVEMG